MVPVMVMMGAAPVLTSPGGTNDVAGRWKIYGSLATGSRSRRATEVI